MGDVTAISGGTAPAGIPGAKPGKGAETVDGAFANLFRMIGSAVGLSGKGAKGGEAGAPTPGQGGTPGRPEAQLFADGLAVPHDGAPADAPVRPAWFDGIATVVDDANAADTQDAPVAVRDGSETATDPSPSLDAGLADADTDRAALPQDHAEAADVPAPRVKSEARPASPQPRTADTRVAEDASDAPPLPAGHAAGSQAAEDAGDGPRRARGKAADRPAPEVLADAQALMAAATVQADAMARTAADGAKAPTARSTEVKFSPARKPAGETLPGVTRAAVSAGKVAIAAPTSQPPIPAGADRGTGAAETAPNAPTTTAQATAGTNLPESGTARLPAAAREAASAPADKVPVRQADARPGEPHQAQTDTGAPPAPSTGTGARADRQAPMSSSAPPAPSTGTGAPADRPAPMSSSAPAPAGHPVADRKPADADRETVAKAPVPMARAAVAQAPGIAETVAQPARTPPPALARTAAPSQAAQSTQPQAAVAGDRQTDLPAERQGPDGVREASQARTAAAARSDTAPDAPAETGAALREIMATLPPVVQAQLDTARDMVIPLAAPLATAPAAPSTAAQLSGQMIDMSVQGQWIDRMAQEIATLAGGSGHSRFQLSPPNLGRVQVDLWQGDNATHVRLLAETDEATRRLRDGQADLETHARMAALSLGSVSVEKSSAPLDSGRDQPGNQTPRQGADSAGQGTSQNRQQAQDDSAAHRNGLNQSGFATFMGSGRPAEAASAAAPARGSDPRVRFA